MPNPTSYALEPSDAWFYRTLDQEAARETAEEQFVQRFKAALAQPSDEGRYPQPVDHWRHEAIEQLYETEKQTTAFNNAVFDLWANPQKTEPGKRLARLLDDAIEVIAKRALNQHPSLIDLH